MNEPKQKTNVTETTTFRGYCLLRLANDMLEEKRIAKHDAFLAMRKNQSIETATAFLQAGFAVEKAEKQVAQVRLMQKHNRRVS